MEKSSTYIAGREVAVNDVLWSAGGGFAVTKVVEGRGGRRVFYQHPQKKRAYVTIPDDARTRVVVPRPATERA
ncbi:hypothetical protein WDJ51_09935 [Rathayibacter sp. YIM 133350]|uniref:hypothetical protein n=1 Tax=Rathayibacter sp. YIM 133350 TaxID=3131992 RepID=UPI00307F8C61